MTVRHATLQDAPLLRDAWNRLRDSIAAWWGPDIAPLYDDNISLGVLRRMVRAYIAEDAVGPLGFFLIHKQTLDTLGDVEHLELHLIGPTNWVQTTRGITKNAANQLRRQTSLDLYTAWFTDAVADATNWVYSDVPPTAPAETFSLANGIGFQSTLLANGWTRYYEHPAAALAKVQVA